MLSDIVLSGFLYVLCGMFLIQSKDLAGGAEFYPRMIAILLLVINTFHLRRALRDKPTYQYNNIGRVLLIFGIALLYAALINVVGFYTMSFIFIIVILGVLGITKKLLYAVIPISVVLFTYVVFSVIFSIPVPSGFLI